MGIGPEPEHDLRTVVAPLLPSEFSVCELGDQIWHAGHRRDPKWWSKPARKLYASMGCGRYESIDANGGGTILADLNKPLDPHPGQFDLVTDFGTSEHCWDFAQVWRTVHSLCKPGGIVMFDKPYQGFPEHGFYNTHKTLWVDLIGANGETIFLKLIEAPRGQVWRGAFRFTSPEFRAPRQGKYKGKLRI